MVKAVELARRMAKQLDKNWLAELEEINLHTIFQPIYKLPSNIITLNTIVAFIPMAYDSDSGWINLKQDRFDNKIDILQTLGANIEDEIIQSVLNLDTSDIQEVIWNYLKRQQDWRFRTITTCFDFHSKHIRSATEPLNIALTDDLEIAKINKAKSELLKEAIRQRSVGEELLNEIRKDHVKLDHVTQTEFNFIATDVEKTDILSWRSFIKSLKQKTIQ